MPAERFSRNGEANRVSDPFEQLSRVRWTVTDGIRPHDWISGTAVPVKNGPYRAVYRLHGPTFDVHVKQNRTVGLRSFARELLRPVKARREFELAAELTRRGIPTPRPLAWGVESRGPGASWLVTETVADAEPLLAVLARPLTPAVRQTLARELGALLARLHEAGVVHRDIHPGNVLVSCAGGNPRLWLIDLHAVSLGLPCSWSQRRDNLVVFNRFFILRASRSDRLRFWTSYRQHSPQQLDAPGQMARELEVATWTSNQQFWLSRDRRCRGTNRYFRQFKNGAISGHVVADFSITTLADPDALFADPSAVSLKDGRSSSVVRCQLDERDVVLKRFNVVDARDPWTALVRPTAALRSWVFGHGLCERGLPTARPLALLQRRRGGLTREEYLLTEFLPGTVELSDFVQRLSTGPRTIVELRERMHALARLIRQMHRRGLSHRDLKAANLLTSDRSGDPRFWFIDLVGVRRHRRVGGRRKVQNLARLHASFVGQPLLTRTEKLRFLRSYLEVGIRGKSGWKDWWRKIDSATRAKQARNAKSGRPLA